MKTVQYVERYEQAAAFLPPQWRRAALGLEEYRKSRAEEFRLRAGRRPTVLLPEGEVSLQDHDGAGVLTPRDLEQMVSTLTDYSRYACAESLKQGYLVLRGGFRLGLCGTAVIRDGKSCGLRDVSSLALRIVREHPGIAKDVVAQVTERGRFQSTLILSPPGGGKTSLLRDVVRQLSLGAPERPALRLAVIDERGEIAACQHGQAQMELGPHTDVLDGCPKAEGIFMLLRAMAPQVIAVDEITAPEDIDAMVQAGNCGVSMLATIHALDRAELLQKPLYPLLKRAGVFRKLVEISHTEDGRSYGVEDF